jgi:hypothetical protein
VGTWSHRSRQSGCEGGTTSSGQTPSVGHAKPCLQRRKWARSLPLDRTSLPQIRTKRQQLLFIFVFYYIPYSNTMIIGRKKSLTPWRINFQKERFCGEKKSPNHTISGKNLLYELFTFKVFTPWPASKTQEGPKVT